MIDDISPATSTHYASNDFPIFHVVLDDDEISLTPGLSISIGGLVTYTVPALGVLYTPSSELVTFAAKKV